MRTIKYSETQLIKLVVVGRKLLSERDENTTHLAVLFWKISNTSEGNYSLKEMRTEVGQRFFSILGIIVGRKLLSERDENIESGYIQAY